MTVLEFYSRVGGNYIEVMRRLGNEDRIKKVLGMLTRDGSCAELVAAALRGDYEAAFRASHTLKGVAMNLGLSDLEKPCVELTETLRSGERGEQLKMQLDDVCKRYDEVIAAIHELLADDLGEGGGENGTEK